MSLESRQQCLDSITAAAADSRDHGSGAVPATPSCWQPSGDDHLIFEWVKMQGKTQSQVARMFGINQSTVSRIVQRYERWQAHLKDRENGRLDSYERYRAQRWLTYERNELMLASCLRIAGEMEGFTELSKSTIRRPLDEPSKQREVRTEERVIDRHGVAARFLRLAFRINMEQLDLVDELEGRRPEPLTDEELAQEDRQAAEDAAELAAARRRADEAVGWDKVAPATAGPPSPSTEYSGPSAAAQAASANQPAAPSTVVELRSPTATQSTAGPNPEPRTLNPLPALHNLHTESAPQIDATATEPCSCVREARLEKNLGKRITGSAKTQSSPCEDGPDRLPIVTQPAPNAALAVTAT